MKITLILPFLLLSTANCSFSYFKANNNTQQQPGTSMFGGFFGGNSNVFQQAPTATTPPPPPALAPLQQPNQAPPLNQSQSGFSSSMFNMLGPRKTSPEDGIFSRHMVCSELNSKDSFIEAIRTYTPNAIRRLLNCPNVDAIVATLNPNDYGNNYEILTKIKAALADYLVLIKVGSTQIDRDRELVYCTDFMKGELQKIKNSGPNNNFTVQYFKNTLFQSGSKCGRGYMRNRIESLLNLALQGQPQSNQILSDPIVDYLLKVLGNGYYQINQARAFIPVNKMGEDRIKAAREVIKAFIGEAIYNQINSESDLATTTTSQMPFVKLN